MKLIDEQIKIAMRNKDKELVLNLKTLKGEIQRKLVSLKEEINEDLELVLITDTIKFIIKSINKTFKGAEKKKIQLPQSEIDKLNKDIKMWEDIQKLFGGN